MVKNSEKTKTNGKKRNDEDETVNKYEDETFTMVNNVKTKRTNESFCHEDEEEKRKRETSRK